MNHNTTFGMGHSDTMSLKSTFLVVWVVVFFVTSSLYAQPDANPNNVDESLRIENAGLIAYNRVVSSMDDIPVNVVYYRADFNHREQFWDALEPSPGVYNFSVFINALNQAQAMGVKFSFRIITSMPQIPVYPSWIPDKRVTRDGRTGYAPDWSHPAVIQECRDLVNALAAQIKDHPAFMFMDAGILGFAGEWHTAISPWSNSDFMPPQDIQKVYVDMMINAFGADKIIANLDMPEDVLRYSMEVGMNGWRQDGFGSTDKFQRSYPPKFKSVPALWDVTGPRFFEIWGGSLNSWHTDPAITWPFERIFDEGLKYRVNMFANMGWPINDGFVDLYKNFHRGMMEYLTDDPEADP